MLSTARRTDRSTAGGTPEEGFGQVSGHLAMLADSSILLSSSSSCLSPRSLAVLAVIRRFRLISSSQIHRMAFNTGTIESSSRRMRRCMERLLELGLVKRFPRTVGGYSGGSGGSFYQPAEGGLRAVKPHVLDTTELFVRLVEAEHAGEIDLLEALPEPLIPVGHVTLKPDVLVDIRSSTGRFRHWLEVDLDSEKKPQLNKKMFNYCLAKPKWSRHYNTGVEKVFPIILFIVPDDKRKEFIKNIIRLQESPEIFRVVLFDDAVRYLTGE